MIPLMTTIQAGQTLENQNIEFLTNALCKHIYQLNDMKVVPVEVTTIYGYNCSPGLAWQCQLVISAAN